MRRSLSHHYQQGQSQFQLGAISFFDDRSQVEQIGCPLLAGFARSGILSTSVQYASSDFERAQLRAEPRRCRQIRWGPQRGREIAFADLGWNKASGF